MQAAYWNGANAVGLGTLGGTNSYGYAINANGSVAGYSDLAGSAATAHLETRPDLPQASPADPGRPMLLVEALGPAVVAPVFFLDLGTPVQNEREPF